MNNALRRAVAAIAFPVLICALTPSIGLAAQQPSKRNGDVKAAPGVVSGRVTIQGKPGKGLTVQAIPIPSPPDQTIAQTGTNQTGADETSAAPAASALTTASGRFRLSNLAPGKYWIKVADEGYVINDPDFDADDGPGSIVTVTPGAGVNNADLKLIPEGIISGRITDSLGSPVVGESVNLIKVVSTVSSIPERPSVLKQSLEPEPSSTNSSTPSSTTPPTPTASPAPGIQRIASARLAQITAT